MLHSIKSTFFELTTPIDISLMSQIEPHLVKDEKIIKIFKSINIAAFFTNKRIVFTYLFDNPYNSPFVFELESLPYTSIKRYLWTNDDKVGNYILSLLTAEPIILSFLFKNSTESISFSQAISEYIL